MRTLLLSLFVVTGSLACATHQVSPAETGRIQQSAIQDGFAVARKEPEPPAHPDLDSLDPYDTKAAA